MKILCITSPSGVSVAVMAAYKLLSNHALIDLLQPLEIDSNYPSVAAMRLGEVIEKEHIDVVIAQGMGAFYALTLPANVRKVIINPIIDPLLDGPLFMLNSVFMSREELKILRQLRRKVLYNVSKKRKANVYAIFFEKQNSQKKRQQEVFMNKYALASNHIQLSFREDGYIDIKKDFYPALIIALFAYED